MKKIEAQEVRTAPAARAEPNEAVYDAEDLIACHGAMGYAKECVEAALNFHHVERAMFADAKKIVDEFMGRLITYGG